MVQSLFRCMRMREAAPFSFMPLTSWCAYKCACNSPRRCARVCCWPAGVSGAPVQFGMIPGLSQHPRPARRPADKLAKRDRDEARSGQRPPHQVSPPARPAEGQRTAVPIVTAGPRGGWRPLPGSARRCTPPRTTCRSPLTRCRGPTDWRDGRPRPFPWRLTPERRAGRGQPAPNGLICTRCSDGARSRGGANIRRYTGDRRSPSPPGRITPDTRVIITQSLGGKAAMITRVSPRSALCEWQPCPADTHPP